MNVRFIKSSMRMQIIYVNLICQSLIFDLLELRTGG
jgi:hypothetical protein